MSFVNVRLSDRVAFGFTGGPEWFTQITQLEGGGEVRNAAWKYPRHRYTAQFLSFLDDERIEILHAFQAVRGRWLAFRFKDHGDFRAVDEPIAVVEGALTPAQLTKTYRMGPAHTVRRIQAPVGSSVVVRDEDGAVVPGALDEQTGLFTPAADWGAGQYTWSGEFDVWVRFDNDFNAFSITNKSGGSFVGTADIELVEVKR